jgi:hypothetical protein
MLGKILEQYRVAFVAVPNINVNWHLNINLGLYTQVKPNKKIAIKFSRKPLVVNDCYENNAIIVDSER